MTDETATKQSLARQMGKSYLQQTINMGNYFKEMEDRHNLKNFFQEMLNTAESQELVDLIQEVQQGVDPEGSAKAFLGFNPNTQYGMSLTDELFNQPFKPPVISDNYLRGLIDIKTITGKTSDLAYIDDYPFVGKTTPAKPEPDWKHPIPVKVKNDGPSKRQRAKLRAKRKK